MSDWQLSLLLHWYDRNAVSLNNSIDSSYGPHSSAVRISTYTVGKNKKAMVELLECRLQRTTAATAEGDATAWFTLVPKDGSTKTLLLARIHAKTLAVKDRAVVGGTLVLHEGDKLTGLTADVSTGGIVTYVMTYKISEFDAEPPKDYIYKPDPTPKEDVQQPEAVKDPPM